MTPTTKPATPSTTVKCDECGYKNNPTLSTGAPRTRCGWCGKEIYVNPAARAHAALVRTLTQADPRSQKVKGIKTLATLGSYLPLLRVFDVKAVLEAIKAEKVTIDELVSDIALPKFARPCPLSPRHGFVDSRVVKTHAELLGIIEETFNAEEDAQLILMPMINAMYNGLWTPTLLTVGPGHDGATSGRDTIILPLAGVHDVRQGTLEIAGLTADHTPYIESVHDSGHGDFSHYITQLRAGPPLTSVSKDYIPTEMTVKRVIKVNGEDLLAWEKVMDAAEPGDVVYHPGGSPTDHYSVHARESSIPVCVTFEPSVGDLLTPPHPPLRPDPLSVLAGIVAGERAHIPIKPGIGDMIIQSHLTEFIDVLFLGLHHSVAMTGEDGVWIGAAAAMMLRFGSLGLRGEVRHLRGRTTSRSYVYARHANRSLTYHMMGLSRLINAFHWGWHGSTGVGGEKWAECGMALKPLFEAVRDLAREPDDAHVSALIKALNIAVNQAHNGGWWLNKFTSHSQMDAIQRGTPMNVLMTCPGVYQIGSTFKRLTPLQIDKHAQRYAKWPDEMLRSVDVENVTASAELGKLNLTLDVRVLGGMRKQRTIPIRILKPVTGSLYLMTDKPQPRVEILTADGKRQVLWTDPPVKLKNAKIKGDD